MKVSICIEVKIIGEYSNIWFNIMADSLSMESIILSNPLNPPIILPYANVYCSKHLMKSWGGYQNFITAMEKYYAELHRTIPNKPSVYFAEDS